jgi:hypothetical protein
MVKLRILSNAFSQKTISTQAAAKAVSDVNKTPLAGFRRENAGGRTPSSAIATITRGLLSSKTFTYASTDKNKRTERILPAASPKTWAAITEAIPLVSLS